MPVIGLFIVMFIALELKDISIWLFAVFTIVIPVAILIYDFVQKKKAREALEARKADEKARTASAEVMWKAHEEARVKEWTASREARAAECAAECAAFDADTEKLAAKIDEVIQEHIKTLARKYNQSVTQDDYGKYRFEKWNQEVAYFMNTAMPELVAKAEGRFLSIESQITDAVHKYRANDAETIVNIDSLNPIEFEHFCADRLRNDGWDARVTQASGDQGIDVIATYGNAKAVFQCKKYAQPVGNGAVQEIAAGKQFEQADIAAVVSNATFTPSAKQLASSTGVHLLHYSELQGFAEKLGMV